MRFPFAPGPMGSENPDVRIEARTIMRGRLQFSGGNTPVDAPRHEGKRALGEVGSLARDVLSIGTVTRRNAERRAL